MEDFGGFTDDIYPTTNELFNTTGRSTWVGSPIPSRPGHPQLGQLPQQQRSEDRVERSGEGLPGLFQAEPDLVYAIKNTLSGPSGSFAAMWQYQPEPNYWYFKKS